MSSKYFDKLISRKRVALLTAAALVALAACGGGGDSGDSGGGGESPGGAAPTPPASSADLPFVIDLARRVQVKRALTPLLAGTYTECITTNASGQSVPGGGPIVVDSVGARASAGSVSTDLLADDSSDFRFTRYFDNATNDKTAFASIGYGRDFSATGFSVTTFVDAQTSPGAVAFLTGPGESVSTGCGGSAPALSSADLFGTFRRFIADSPVRMKNCLTTLDGIPSGPVAAGEVSMGARDITVNGVQVSFDAPGKQGEIITVSYNQSVTLEYLAKWQERDVAISMDDAGNIRSVLIGDTGTAVRIVSCERPVR